MGVVKMQDEVKNKMFSIVDNLHWQLEQAELELRQQIKKLEEKNSEFITFSRDNRRNWFQFIVDCMVNGLSYEQAFQLLCENYKLEAAQIKRVFEAMDYQRRATILYAKIYMIRTLKEAGFTNTKIAEIMHICAATVARLAKCNIKI